MYYIVKNQIHFKNQKKAAEEIGITPETLSRILNGKIGTTKITAYCITKYYNKDAEINDYFIREGE